MPAFTFDRIGFRIGGEDQYLISGEFHYFRVPKADWRRRMDLFKAAGGNCLASYVPWQIHEPEEGHIVFGDVENRDLQAFLETARDAGLNVLLRPGPYQYSELYGAGLPGWLLRDYPQVRAVDLKGRTLHRHSVSYLHPLFLEKARRYYRAFADQVRPYMVQNGGPVVLLQVDNELMGIHVWYGSLDYHPVTMGFGDPNGRYPQWLKRKYGSIDALNEAYNTDFDRFDAVMPIDGGDREDIHVCRRIRDYHAFYRGTIAEYAALLKSWLREDGLDAPIAHNSANPGMNALFTETVDAMGDGFLLGSDHYYTLNQSWPQNNPTPQYLIRALMSCDTMRALGMPPSVMELPGGSPSDTPPILQEDLLACYMANVAVGAKGVNLYIYTGGPNFPGTGETCDVYDYHALVRADGAVNETFASLEALGRFCKAHPWMQRAERAYAAQIGFEWDTLRSEDWDDRSQPFTRSQCAAFIEKGLVYTIMCSRYAPMITPFEVITDRSRPLIVPCPGSMSAAAQQAVVDHIMAGGRALILPAFPTVDEEGRPCDILWRACGCPEICPAPDAGPAVAFDGVGNVYGLRDLSACRTLPERAQALARGQGGQIMCYEQAIGQGKIIWLGCTWEMSTFPQAMMLEALLKLLGAQTTVVSSNRNVFTALWRGDGGQRALFVMNLYSGAQQTDITVGDEPLGRLSLKPMEVRLIDL